MEVMLTLQLSGLGLSAQCNELINRLDNVEAALREAGEYMVGSVMENFNAQGRPVPWKPDAPGTVKRKGHDVILVETGLMMNSVTYRVEGGRLEIFCPVRYAGYANADRPFLIMQKDDVQAVKDIIEKGLTGG